MDRQSALEATDTGNNEEVEDPKDSQDPDSMEYKVGNVLNRLSLDLPMLKEKSIQAFELSGHRIGLTFLGTSFSGKTLCIRTLLEAMSVGEAYSLKAVHINPVALGPRHLFGWYDISTNEWTDGTFTSMWRRSARSESLKIWVVMDGPMNTTWIEYLNSIMDDSQMFTLPNGDRIPTKTGNKLVLEVDKLISASPATLSRTGVVYFPSSTVGYQALLGSWLAKRRTEESAAISSLFERFAEPVIEAVQKLPRFSSLPVNIAAQTNNFLSLLESFLADSVIAGELPARAVLERYLIVSLGWAFTGPMLFEDRKKMDNIFEGITSNLPTPANGYTLIDNILTDTAEGASQVWTSAHSLCKWEYPTIEDGDDYVTGRTPKFIVPTPRSVTTTYVTKWLVDPRICILVAGARGSGKSTICTAILKSMFSKNKLGEEKNKLTARVTLSFQTTNHQFQVTKCLCLFCVICLLLPYSLNLLLVLSYLNFFVLCWYRTWWSDFWSGGKAITMALSLEHLFCV
jgi:dynein heavy chain